MRAAGGRSAEPRRQTTKTPRLTRSNWHDSLRTATATFFQIPFAFNSAANSAAITEWFITGIDYGDSLRDKEDKRRKQHLTLTLTENVPLQGANEANQSHKGHGIGKWHAYSVRKPISIEEVVVHVLKRSKPSEVQRDRPRKF